MVATAGGPAKAEFVRSLGADVVIDHRAEDIAARVRAETGGRGADAIYDPVGGEAFDAATRAIAHEGRLLVVGFASGRWGTPQSAHIATHNYSVVGVIPSGYDRAFKQQAQDWLLPRFQSGELRVPIARRHAFDALPAGLTALEAGDVSGRCVLEVA